MRAGAVGVLAARPRATAWSISCQASSQLMRSSRAAPCTSHSVSTSTARRSNRVVNRDMGSNCQDLWMMDLDYAAARNREQVVGGLALPSPDVAGLSG